MRIVIEFDDGPRGGDRAIADLVAELRATANLTQTELAARMGTKQPVVSRWESGADEPRLSTLRRLAAGCGYQLALTAEPDGVDRAQLRQQLAMTPEERLASVVNLSQTLAAARPVAR